MNNLGRVLPGPSMEATRKRELRQKYADLGLKEGLVWAMSLATTGKKLKS